jgi:Na+-driven multidrug efflux pump
VQFACSYAWALVPSFYLTSFIDTNKNYLLSQGVIFPPIVIHFLTACLHITICLVLSSNHPLGLLTSAWAKNITDSICALSIYLFIIIKEPTK